MTNTLDRLTAALAGRYRIGRELGTGGMATVWLAHDLKHDREVAVKVLHPQLAAALGSERFLKEIKTTANLQHPHILALHDSGEADGLLFYVMPFVDGESLRHRLARETKLPVDDAVRITSEVAGALDYAHRHGVIHRDIKPENILLHDGSALVADFGIALAPATGDIRLTETGMSMGTPPYMSPEQALGDRQLDARSDIYAVGAVLYEMLTGAPPFTGPSAQAIVAKVITEKPVPPSRVRREVPSHVEDAVLTALQKRPDDRFATAAALQTALVAGGPASGRRRRRRRTLVLGALGALAIAAAAVFVGTQRRAAPSIAVLRFVNGNGDTSADAYLSDGIGEEVQGGLAGLPGLVVRGTNSSFHFKDANQSLRVIGDSLDVGTLVVLHIGHFGEALRVTTELHDVRRDVTIWSATYTQGMTTDLNAIDDSISLHITDSLKLKLTPAQRSASRAGRTEDPAAHLLLVRASGYAQRRTPQAMETAVTLYEEAIAQDSNYAEAWAGLAEVQNLRGVFLGEEPAPMFDSARVAIRRALKLDSNSADAHKALGFWHIMRDRNLPEAGREFTQALKLNRNDPETWLFRGWYFLASNQIDSAIESMQHGKRIDPLAAIIGTRLGGVYYYAGKGGLAENELKEVLRQAPEYHFARTQLAQVYASENRCQDALQLPLAPEARDPAEISQYRFMDAVCKRPQQAQAYVDSQDVAAAKGKYVEAFWLASVWAGLDNEAKTLSLLAEAVRKNEWAIFLLRAVPAFNAYRSDPRFQELDRKVYGNSQ
jgi:eukaryotic-like serine/threonine-protein kinase